MSENIGTITVAIEAQTQALEEALVRAEKIIEQSAKQMEASQQGLGKKFSKSWTEMNQKVMLYEKILDGASKAIDTFSDSIKILGDESMESHEKTIALFDSFANAGIPVASQFVGVVQSLAYAFSDLGEVQASVAESLAYLNEQQQMLSLTRNLNTQIEKLELQKELGQMLIDADKERLAGGSGIELQYEAQRKQLQETFNIENNALEQKLASEGKLKRFIVDQLEIRKQKQSELIDLINQKEQMALEAWQKIQDEKQAELDRQAKAEEERLEQQTIDRIEAEKRVAKETLDLQTQLDIMVAKQAGDEEKARTIAINARYEAMKKGATDVQRKIIEMMQAIELEGVKEKDTPVEVVEERKTGRPTASISTAIGSFTIAKQGMEQKKQTSLLERIAKSNEKVADKLTQPQTNGSIIPAV